MTKKNPAQIKAERRPGESVADCVSRKIPILIGEGMKPDQATAVANEICKLTKGFWKDVVTKKDSD